MESRAKQRLTGAVILVALFVLLVPELLTGPGDKHPPADSPTDEGLRRYTIELDAQNSTGQPMAPAGGEAPVALPEVPPSANPAPANMAPEHAVPGEAAAPPAEPAVATNPAQPPNNLASAPAAPAPAPAATPRADAPRAAPVNPPRGSFVVQLGSFGSRDNADRLVRDMSAKGFKAFVAPIKSGGRELYRVRVGPTRDRASAEALAADLKRAGQSGSIVPIS